MPTTNDDLPIVFNKILKEFENKDGEMTVDELKEVVYKLRYTRDEIINEIYDIDIDRELIKEMLYVIHLSKHDVKDILKWLSTNGYITIDHSSRKDIIILNEKKL